MKTAFAPRPLTQAIVVDKPPSADFTATPRSTNTVDAVSFTDTTRAGTEGNTKAIVARQWQFGDGAISTATNPTHLYTTAGVYTVSLTVTYAHSDTGLTFTDVEAQRANYITVVNPTPPTPLFTLGTSCLFTGNVVSFVDASTAGTRPVTGWSWRFGDGATSTQQNPFHAFSAQGNYNVSLTVTSDGLPAPFNTATYTQEIYITDVQDLDDFVNTFDPAASYAPVGDPIPVRFGTTQIATAYNIYMVSQTWRSAAEIYTGNFDGRIWNHNLTIVRPNNILLQHRRVAHQRAIASTGRPMRTSSNSLNSGLIAAATGCVFTIIDNVPAQPIEFADERIFSTYNQRTEDEILAYSFDKYLKSFNAGTPDITWPALFPMTKAAVRAMDNVQEFMATKGVSVDDFIVTGGSKRGWTTWLTGINDCRVPAIAPLVIDLLNIDESVSRQLQVLTATSRRPLPITNTSASSTASYPGPTANRPRTASRCCALSIRLNTANARASRSCSSTPLATSSSCRIRRSSRSTRSRAKSASYLPNTSHGLTQQPDLGDDGNVAAVLASWVLAVVEDVPRPTITWNYVDNNTLDVTLQAPVPAGTSVKLWQATNADNRDFRKLTIGNGYRATTLSDPDGDGTYRAIIANPTAGWRAYLVQVKIPSSADWATPLPGAPDPKFVFSTPVKVIPDNYRFPEPT